MSDKKLNFELPTEIVESAVRDKICAAIARELGDPAEIIKRQVQIALSEKVDSTGQKNTYNSHNTHSFLEVQASLLIKSAAKEALIEFFNDNKKAIKEAVKKELLRSPNKMAKVFMDGITEGLTATYGSTVTINFKNGRE